MTNLVSHIQNIEGLQISQNKKSQRIIDIQFKDELIDKLIFPYPKSKKIYLVYFNFSIYSNLLKSFHFEKSKI